MNIGKSGELGRMLGNVGPALRALGNITRRKRLTKLRRERLPFLMR